MRIKIGKVVDLDKDVNLADLSPMDRIIASATYAYRNTDMYKRRYAETEEKKEEQRRRVRETLSDALLAVITPELETNKTLSKQDDTCRGMLVEVPSRFKNFIPEVVDNHEFDSYDVTIIPPTKSISKFCNPPYLLYIEGKEGVG